MNDANDLIKRLRAKEYFSDDLMAARTQTDCDLIDKYRAERKEAADMIEMLNSTLEGWGR